MAVARLRKVASEAPLMVRARVVLEIGQEVESKVRMTAEVA